MGCSHDAHAPERRSPLVIFISWVPILRAFCAQPIHIADVFRRTVAPSAYANGSPVLLSQSLYRFHPSFPHAKVIYCKNLVLLAPLSLYASSSPNAFRPRSHARLGLTRLWICPITQDIPRRGGGCSSNTDSHRQSLEESEKITSNCTSGREGLYINTRVPRKGSET